MTPQPHDKQNVGTPPHCGPPSPLRRGKRISGGACTPKKSTCLSDGRGRRPYAGGRGVISTCCPCGRQFSGIQPKARVGRPSGAQNSTSQNPVPRGPQDEKIAGIALLERAGIESELKSGKWSNPWELAPVETSAAAQPATLSPPKGCDGLRPHETVGRDRLIADWETTCACSRRESLRERDAGNLHVRFDKGERRGIDRFLSYSTATPRFFQQLTVNRLRAAQECRVHVPVRTTALRKYSKMSPSGRMEVRFLPGDGTKIQFS